MLFVDDEDRLVDVAKQMLTYLGYRVTGTTKADEALEISRSEPGNFDLVMTDLTMPGMTRLRLAKETTEIRPEMPIILCTGFSERFTGENLQATGIRELLMVDAAPAIRR